MKFKDYAKKAISLMLALIIVVELMPIQQMKAAQSGDEYAIANDYIKYSINFKTGGFCIETKDGHPQKTFDNNIPLLYKEDRSRSNGTSFTTIRIDGKDYIFGQDYGWFGISSQLHMPVISDEGRLLTVDWDIKGYTVTQKVAISIDKDNPLCGNVGISYTVKNNNTKAGNVGIRLMLDNALDTNVDAPYVMVDQIAPTLVETEYAGKVPQQIRYMDSLSKPDKMAYALLSGWSGTEDVAVDKVVVGHWVNLANTRYNYTANPSCDFSNYSNEYLTPDTATAYYWTEKALAAGESRVSEMLYGIGNFASELSDQHLGININVGKVELDAGGKAYKDGGEFEVKATIDNSVNGARVLVSPIIKLTVDEGLVFKKTGTREYQVAIEGGLEIGSVRDFTATVIADKQAQITSRRIVISVNATEVVDESTQRTVEYSANSNVLLPAVGGIIPNVVMNQVNPEKVYYEGEKSVTISGNMKALSEAIAASDGWSLHLVSDTTREKVLIKKSSISFIGEGTTMSFSTNETLSIGTYSVEFTFTDKQLIKAFGTKIKASVSLGVSNDPLDRCASYGIVAMIRFENSSRRQLYDFVSFANEADMKSFTDGIVAKQGLQHTGIKYDEDSSELLLVLRGKLRRMIDAKGNYFYQANKEDSDITINSILTYCGDEPLKLTCDKDGAKVVGDGTLKVINSINVWHNEWSFSGTNGTKVTLNADAVEEGDAQAFELSLDGAGSVAQFLGGFLIDMKYGVMTMDDDKYGVSFGGKITLPIKAGGGDKKDSGGGKKDGGDKKDDDDDEGPDEGEISAEVEDVLFGNKDDDSIGFIGLNTTLSVKLPSDVLGSMVKNAFGVEAEVTINTIENYYRFAFALELTMLECEGSIAFKQVPIMSVPRVIPDELFFYLGGEIMQVPIVPPFVMMTGLGGGYKGLADTLSDDCIGELPPMTLMLKTQLLMIETLTGDFALEVSLSGFMFEGEFKLVGDDDGKIMKMNCGMALRWVSPFSISAYGQIELISGLLRGGFTIKISDDYFYGYIYAGIFIPDEIPLVGGMELAGVEAAVSTDFVGANVVIIGIKFGFIYYWDGDYKFGKGIDLSSRGAAVTFMPEEYINDAGERVDYTAVYGTNMRRLKSVAVASTRAGGGIVKYFDPTTEDALLMEIPLSGIGKLEAKDITLTDPTGKKVDMVLNDGKGGGNYLIQTRNNKQYLYITITDKKQLIAGNWTLNAEAEGVKAESFEVNGVDNLPSINGVSFAHATEDSRELTVNWTTDDTSDVPGTLDIYLTRNPNAMKEMEKDNTDEKSAMTAIARVDLNKMESGTYKVTLPKTMEEGDYYVVAMLSQHEGGMSKVMSANTFKFVNNQLPAAPEVVALTYAGNGAVRVNITDAKANGGNYYLVSLIDQNGAEIAETYAKYAVGQPVEFRPVREGSNEPVLIPNQKYTAKVMALREVEEDGQTQMYYSTASKISAPLVMPETKCPQLTKVVNNLPKGETEIYVNTANYKATYTFDMPVQFALNVNGSTAFSGKEYKNEWTVDIKVDDGPCVVDFVANTKQNDSSTGNDFVITPAVPSTTPGTKPSTEVPVAPKSDMTVSTKGYKLVPGALVGFNVDTRPPVLTLGETAAPSMDANVPETSVSQQTVFVGENGSLAMKGLTEKGANITFNGTTDGITVTPDGIFTINRTIISDKASQAMTLKAIDKAGNETALQITVANRALATFESLQLLSDLESTGAQTKYVEMSVGNRTQLTVNGVMSAGNNKKLLPQDVTWSVLYEQNAVRLTQEGMLTAVAPGETVIKASYRVAEFNDNSGKTVYNELSDIITVKIKDTGYRYEMIQTQGCTVLTINAPKTKGMASISINGKPTVMLYDESKQAYVGAFSGNVTSEQLLDNLSFETAQPAVILIKGDSNGDKKIDNIDVAATLEVVIREDFGGEENAKKWVLYDVNHDNIINIIDAQLILGMYLYGKGAGK